MNRWMAEALREAAKGLGNTSPNPAVGAVIVRGRKIIARGHHRFFGGPHAEVEALRQIQDPRKLKDATLVCTLEPCDHFGKTPPCTEAILKAGIGRVVIGMRDPHGIVAGRGIQKLRRHGVDVVLLENPAVLNFYAPYRIYHARKRPFVTLKLAVSLDGKLAARGVKWITGIEARREVQRIRSRVDAILVGRRTAVADNPRLTIRPPFVESRIRPPVRIVLSASGKVPKNLRLFHDRSAPTWVIRNRVTTDLKKCLRALARRGIMHLLVEGGARTAQSFLREDLVDEILLFVAPRRLGDRALNAFSPGTGRGRIRRPGGRDWRLICTQEYGRDTLLTFHPKGS